MASSIGIETDGHAPTRSFKKRRTSPQFEKKGYTMDIPQSDAFVFFGATGDLAFKKISGIARKGPNRTPPDTKGFIITSSMRRTAGASGNASCQRWTARFC
jgi:hypothetical protein